MNEQNISQNQQAEPGDLEQRLRVYYGPHCQSNPFRLLRGTLCVIDSGFKQALDAGAAFACVFHEKDREPLCPPRCKMLLRASPLRLAFLPPRWCCATG